MESLFLGLRASSLFSLHPLFILFLFSSVHLCFLFPSLFPLNTSLTNWLTSLHEYPNIFFFCFLSNECISFPPVFTASLFCLSFSFFLSFFLSLSSQWFDYFLLFLQACFLRQIVRAGCGVRRGREGRDGRTGTRELSFTFISLLKTLHRKLLQTYHR